MDYLVVCLTALFAAGLTLFSGFGLGTLLLPVLALFFPVELAVSATAAVHLLNNVFKLGLVGRDAQRRAVIAFGLPAAAAALLGAWLLTLLADLPVLLRYSVGGWTGEITAIRLVIAFLIFVFALADLLPRLDRVAFPPRFMPLGGMLSGLFGGLSGHQGALRSAFLIKAGLTREQFIGTSATCAVLVDVARLGVYGTSFFAGHFAELAERGAFGLLGAASLAAFLGSFLGARLVRKVTLAAIQRLVGALLLVVALLMGAGVL